MDKSGNSNRLSLAEQQSIFRILDASANRCREGLRVIEEFIRFHQENEQNVQAIKSARHQFSLICAELDLEQAIHARDTPGDVGTKITLPTEMSRQSLKDLVRANCSRVGESLRTLEEYSKLIAKNVPAKFEQIRYQFYEIEKQLLTENSLQARLENSSLYFLMTASQCKRVQESKQNFEAVAREAIGAGIDVIQLREKNLTDRDLLNVAKQLREWTAGTQTLFIVNDRPDIALLCDADGVHVGQSELGVEEVRKIIGSDKLIGVSSHNLDQAKQAVSEGANYLGVGPVYESQTKQFAQFPGLDLLKEIAASQEITNTPWFAIGGINRSNIEDICKSGASRIAVSQSLSDVATTSQNTTFFKSILKKRQQFSELKDY